VKNNSQRVIVLGGDGFCGWPTALHLSASGYDVCIVDNLSRRKIDIELETNSLTPITPISQRLQTWQQLTNKKITFHNINVAKDYAALLQLIQTYRPHAIVHFAEQRSAPYSMLSSTHKHYTVDNNINATHHVLSAIVESKQNIHLVHLGTMGVYGYGAIQHTIPEGYLSVHLKQESGQMQEYKILYPADPGSIYHMTKTQDALMFHFYNKNDKLCITDLHQGIVWGTTTPETRQHDDLINRFDYDGEYGTVLNRFLVQGAINHPLTVYGTGKQTRAFIHLQNTTECIRLAIENPPAKGERVKIFNQATETHSIIDLANIVAKLTGAQIQQYANPRNELAENDLSVSNEKFLGLGLNAITLNDGLLNEVLEIAQRFADRIDSSKIISRSLWSADKQADIIGISSVA